MLARDVASGQEKVVQMKSAVDVDDAAVQRMVEESVDHAFEDLEARRWIETRLKANQLLDATRKALADCAGELEPDYRRQVEEAMRQVEATVSREDAAGLGATKELKAACDALDEATRPMAEVLMDRAMEAVLRKRGAIK